jgi:acyl carrier protein
VNVTAELPGPTAGDAADLGATVRRLFAEVLKVDSVSADDNFFELGGHSLMVILLADRVTGETGLRVSVREVFDGPTAGAVTALLQSRRTP